MVSWGRIKADCHTDLPKLHLISSINDEHVCAWRASAHQRRMNRNPWPASRRWCRLRQRQRDRHEFPPLYQADEDALQR